MTPPGPPLGWDLFQPLDVLTAMWSTMTVTPVNWMVTGRRLTVKVANTDLRLTVTHFDPQLNVRQLSVGRLTRVRLSACDIEWDAGRVDQATAVLHDVRISPSAAPELVATPVHLTVEVPASALDDLFGLVAPRLSGEVGADGVARLRLARRPTWGHLEVDALLDDSILRLHARALVRGRLRWRLPARIPGYPVHLPELPHGLRLTEIGFSPDRVHLSGTLPEWRMPVSVLPPM